MRESAPNTNTLANPQPSLRQQLFNPFKTLAGTRALLLGLSCILITAAIASLSNTHFDGVLDVHTGLEAPAWFFFAESLINWLCLALLLSLAALIVSKSKWRFIDVIGTQAFARWPTLLTALVMLPDGNRRFAQYLVSKLTQDSTLPPYHTTDATIFTIAAVVSLIMIVWMVALMYKAYAVSCNLKGAKAIISFIIALILAEAASKVVILVIIAHTSSINTTPNNATPQSSQSTSAITNFQIAPQPMGAWQGVDVVTSVENFRLATRQSKDRPSLQVLVPDRDVLVRRACPVG